MSDNQRVVIFDTTLRDGEQSPGHLASTSARSWRSRSSSPGSGSTSSRPGSRSPARATSRRSRPSPGPCRARSSPACPAPRCKDVDRCWEAVQHAERSPDPRLHRHLRDPHEEQAADDPGPGEGRGRRGRRPTPGGYTDDVEFSPEDASRSDFDFMCEVLPDRGRQRRDHAEHPRHRRLRHPRGVRRAPAEHPRTGDAATTCCPTHCHDDLGLAVANSLAAVEAGARQVECAINGIGERAGNAALEEIVMALRTRSDYFGGPCDTERARPRSWPDQPRWSAASPATRCSTTRPSSAATPSPTRPASTSTACSRTRTHLRDHGPDRRRPGRAQIVLGKHSGRHAFADTLEKMGLHRPGRRAEPGVRPLQGAGRPQGARSPTPTSRRSSPRSSARHVGRRLRAGLRSSSGAATSAPPAPTVVLVATARRSRPRPRATA